MRTRDTRTRTRFLTTTNPTGSTDTINVEPYDWGGWSTLTVTAYLADGRSVTGKLRGAAETGARLPKRAKDSFVSDYWKASNIVGDHADAADDDASPESDSTPGDGLTLYQEYRGFYDGYRHAEGKPDVKDLFVLNRGRVVTIPGIIRFKAISGLNVHYLLTEDELPDSRIINANRGVATSVTPQHAVIVEIDPKFNNRAKAIGVNDSSRDPQSRYGDAADLRGNCRDQVLVTDAIDAPSRCCPAPAGCSCP